MFMLYSLVLHGKCISLFFCNYSLLLHEILTLQVHQYGIFLSEDISCHSRECSLTSSTSQTETGIIFFFPSFHLLNLRCLFLPACSQHKSPISSHTLWRTKHKISTPASFQLSLLLPFLFQRQTNPQFSQLSGALSAEGCGSTRD